MTLDSSWFFGYDPCAPIECLNMKNIVTLVLALSFAIVNGQLKVNPKKINVTEFMDVMQTCGDKLGFDREFKLSFFGSKEDFSRTICLSFCALRKLKLYTVEDEIKVQLANATSEKHFKIKEEVNKAFDICQSLLDDPCRLFDCFFDYSKTIDGKTEPPVNLTKFFFEGKF